MRPCLETRLNCNCLNVGIIIGNVGKFCFIFILFLTRQLSLCMFFLSCCCVPLKCPSPVVQFWFSSSFFLNNIHHNYIYWWTITCGWLCCKINSSFEQRSLLWIRNKHLKFIKTHYFTITRNMKYSSVMSTEIKYVYWLLSFINSKVRHLSNVD